MSQFFHLAFKIKPEELNRVLLMFIFSLCTVANIVVGRNISKPLLLSYFPEALQYMYLTSAVVVSLSSFIFMRIIDYFRRDRMLIFSFSLFAISILLFRSVLHFSHNPFIYPLLYAFFEVVGTTTTIQFWTFANDVFDSRQAKRLFGFIGIGGVLAAIIFGFGGGYLAKVLGVENLLYVCFIITLVCIFSVFVIGKQNRAQLQQILFNSKKKRKETVDDKKRGVKSLSDTGRIFQSKHLKIIATIVCIMFISTQFIDYQFQMYVKSKYSGDELSAFFGYFIGFSGLISFVIQTFFTTRVLERFGVVVSLSLLPIFLLGSTGVFLIIPTLFWAVMAKGSENCIRYTLNDATMQLLYSPVPAHVRGRAKNFIDGVLKPLSIGVAGLVLLLFKYLYPDFSDVYKISYIAFGMFSLWLFLVIRIRKEYVDTLLTSLRRSRIESGDTRLNVSDDSTKKVLRLALKSENEAEIINALELIPDNKDGEWDPDLMALLSNPSPVVRIAAIKRLGMLNKMKYTQAISGMFRDPDEYVKAAAISAFCELSRERAIHVIKVYLEDKSPAVKGSAVSGLIKHGGLDGILQAAEELKAMLVHNKPEMRKQAAKVLGDIQVKNFYQPVLELLQDPEPEVVTAAIEAAGNMQSPELVPALIYKLAQPKLVIIASKALSRYGKSIENILCKVLSNQSEDKAIRKAVPKIIAEIGSEIGFDILLTMLEDPDPNIRFHVARAASKIKEKITTVKFSQIKIDEILSKELQSYYQQLAIIEDLQFVEDLKTLHFKHPQILLKDALIDRLKRTLNLIFALLEIKYPSSTINLIYMNMQSEHKNVRANAIELIDNLLDQNIKKLLLPIVEEGSGEEKIKSGAENFEIIRDTQKERLLELLKDRDPWILTCTIYMAERIGMKNLLPEIEPLLEHTNPLVRETTLQAIKILGDSEKLKNAAQKRSEDGSKEVRMAAQQILSAFEMKVTATVS